MIISVLAKSSGFFSTFFFTLNHYIFCRRNQKNFQINSQYWLFKYKNGWTDYFNNVMLRFREDNSTQIQQFGHMNELGSYSLYEYKAAIKELYVYNDSIKELIKSKKNEYGLTDNNYDSIFIRRGDKMTWESKLIPTHKYIELLLKQNPKCNTIFLQTDDYNSYQELEEYVRQNKLDIRVICFCDPKYKGGMVMNRYNLVHGLEPESKKENGKNYEYVSTNIENYLQNKPVTEMNPDEIYKHTTEMIIGLDIVFCSNMCVLDYQSNVSRFIKLAHNNINNVIDVYNSNTLDMEQTKCPAYDTYGFENYGAC